MKKRKRLVLFAILCLLVCIRLLSPMFARYQTVRSMIGTRGLFSWSSAVLTDTGRAELFSVMERENLDTLYQFFSSDTETDTIRAFLEDAAQRDITVWFLTGEPKWGLDGTGDAMQTVIRRVASLQATLPENVRFKGVFMDCEPYLTDEWDSDPSAVMDSWCRATESAHMAANEAGLLFTVCIPYYLDTKGFSDSLKQIVENGCDALAIMNYYKQNEAAHIETEMALASDAGTPVTVIYELQPPGTHRLVENNTYYHDGLPAVENSWDAIRKHFGRRWLSIAFHEYNALKEVMMRE